MTSVTRKQIAIIGAVGVPANYGGFETLVENLVRYHASSLLNDDVTVYCSSKKYPEKKPSYFNAQLKYIPLKANGFQSILYDFISLLSAVRNRSDVILLLGVSGAAMLPVIKLISSAKIITNIDGIEWRREKWKGMAKTFLRFSEKIAVHYSDDVITDNHAISHYVELTYGVKSHVIAYGGDHVVADDALPVDEYDLPARYVFSVCRIEPENNMHMILEAFSQQENYSLVIVGNWNNSGYGRDLREKYSNHNGFYLLDPIYDLGKLKTLHRQATVYVHGHSMGGTNPSLVEAMHFNVPVVAFDCEFNRSTTEDKALYFSDAQSLQERIDSLDETLSKEVSLAMVEIAQRRYIWDIVAPQYFDLLYC